MTADLKLAFALAFAGAFLIAVFCV